MYIPKINSWENLDEILAFIDRFSFGTLISKENSRIVATHIPILYRRDSQKLILEAHIALGNSQWKDLEKQEVLVIFSEPHAYISTENYLKHETVPTWNYIAVHMYGHVKLVKDHNEIEGIMERTIVKYEPAYFQKWQGMSEEFKSRMLKGIVPFQIEITDVQAKAKLSQNKTEQEIDRISTSLKNSASPVEALLAEYMKTKQQ